MRGLSNNVPWPSRLPQVAGTRRRAREAVAAAAAAKDEAAAKAAAAKAEAAAKVRKPLELSQKLGQRQPFLAVLPRERAGQNCAFLGPGASLAAATGAN